MVSNAPSPPPAIIAARSKGAPSPARVKMSTSVAENPESVAVTVTSAPRATVAFPGCTSMRYGLAASTPDTGTSTASAPCLR